jgi:hypothetical protein
MKVMKEYDGVGARIFLYRSNTFSMDIVHKIYLLFNVFLLQNNPKNFCILCFFLSDPDPEIHAGF